MAVHTYHRKVILLYVHTYIHTYACTVHIHSFYTVCPQCHIWNEAFLLGRAQLNCARVRVIRYTHTHNFQFIPKAVLHSLMINLFFEFSLVMALIYTHYTQNSLVTVTEWVCDASSVALPITVQV